MISVVMPVYNAGEFVQETIESVLQQTYENFELLIVNDGSTDKSLEIIHSFQDPRVVCIHSEHKGVAAARNLALDAIKGDFVVWHDADDVSLKSRFALQMSQFHAPGVGFVHSDCLRIDREGNPLGYDHKSQIHRMHLLRYFLKVGTPFVNHSMMLRKEVLDGLRFDTSLQVGEDTALVAKFMTRWEGVHIAEPLLLYRKHPLSLLETVDEASEYFLHIKNMIHTHTLEELIPEAYWGKEEKRLKDAMAYTILYFFLARRNLPEEAIYPYLNQAYQLASGDSWMEAMMKDLVGLARIKCQIHQKIAAESGDLFPHIKANYQGELFLLYDRPLEAYSYFLDALTLYPDYQEPLDNLRMVGAICNLRKRI